MFGQYLGPDEDTLELLTTYADVWYCEPYKFWDDLLKTGCDFLVDPQEQIYSAFLQTRHDHA